MFSSVCCCFFIELIVYGNDENGAWKDYTTSFENNDIEDENSYITESGLSTLSITKGTKGEVTAIFPSGIEIR